MASLLVESASHLSIWAVGLVAAIYFLQEFEAELKPLVLAFIFVSILEAVVQCLEWVFQKTWCLFKLLLWKVWQLIGITCIHVCRCPSEKKERSALVQDVLYNWSNLTQAWDGRAAGTYAAIRILAVALTLILVALLALVIKGVIEQQVSTVIGKFDLYKHQITNIASFLNDQIPHVENLGPENLRNETKTMVAKIKANINSAAQELPSFAEGMGLNLLNDVLATSSARIMDLAFFLLYSAFMLFDPLHINFDEHEDEVGDASSPKRRPALADGWLRRTSSNLLRKVTNKMRASGAAARRSPLRGWMSGLEGHSRQPSVQPLLGGLGRGSQRRGNAGAPASAEEVIQSTDSGLHEFGGFPDKEGRDVQVDEAGAGSHSEGARGSGHEDEEEESPPADGSGAAGGEGVRLTELQYYIYKIVWHYFLLTVVLNAIFASLVLGLLMYLNVDLSVLLAAWCFILGFIPELGAFISMALPIPFILLTPTEECLVPTGFQRGDATYYHGEDIDCISDFNARLQHVAVSVGGMLLIKFLVSNILSAILMGRNRTLAGAVTGDTQEEVRETHGVLVLFAVVFFGKIWGTVGMLISVPVLSVVRLTLNMGSERDRHRQKRMRTISKQMEEMLKGRGRSSTFLRMGSVLEQLSPGRQAPSRCASGM